MSMGEATLPVDNHEAERPAGCKRQQVAGAPHGWPPRSNTREEQRAENPGAASAVAAPGSSNHAAPLPALLNPKGIPPRSPGLRACELPWAKRVALYQPRKGLRRRFTLTEPTAFIREAR